MGTGVSILLFGKGEKEGRLSEEKMIIIGFRVPPGFKQWANEMAVERGETLTDFIWTLIDAGVEQMFPLKE